MRGLADLSKEIHNLTKELHDHASSEARERLAVDDRIDHALYGGNGDGEGIYERLRKFLSWKAEHIQTHQSLSVERRTAGEDWRRFWIGVADRTFTVFFAVLGILIVFAITGRVITLP